MIFLSRLSLPTCHIIVDAKTDVFSALSAGKDDLTCNKSSQTPCDEIIFSTPVSKVSDELVTRNHMADEHMKNVLKKCKLEHYHDNSVDEAHVVLSKTVEQLLNGSYEMFSHNCSFCPRLTQKGTELVFQSYRTTTVIKQLYCVFEDVTMTTGIL